MSDDPAIGTCFNCAAPCTEEDYCYGCKTLICSKCSPYYDGADGHNHRPDEHLLYFPTMNDGEFTCRRVVGMERKAGVASRVLCGKPAAFSAYCREHLHAVIDERLAAGEPS